MERRWQQRGREHRQLHDGITSLDPLGGPPARLLALKRGHWGIENRLHRVEDVTFGEDASLIHLGAGSLVLAYLRDTAITVLALAGVRQVAAARRRLSQRPEEVIRLLGSATHA